MVKSLSDLCLTQLASSIHKFTDLGNRITREQCETLIERMCAHDQFDPLRLPSIAQFLFTPLLRDICFAGSMQINDSVLRLVATSGCTIRTLKILRCKNVSDVGIAMIIKDQQEMESLTLRSLPLLTGKCFESLRSLKLKVVDLKYCDSLMSCYVSVLATNCPNLQSLNLSMCQKLDGSAVSSIAQGLKEKLEVIKLNSMSRLREEGVISIAEHCPNLKIIKLYGCSGISSDAVEKLLKNCKISVLDLSYCYKVPQGLQKIPAPVASTLTKLVYRGVQLSRETLLNFCKECVHLTCLEVCGVHCVDDDTIDEIVRIRGDQLQELDVSWCRPLTDSALTSVIMHCAKIVTLSIGYCENITGKSLELLGRTNYVEASRSLRRLMIGACRKGDASIFEDFIRSCSNLEELNTAGLKGMNDYYLSLLARHCPRLKALNIKGCQQVTDAGVCELVASCQVKELVLSGIHNLTDRTIFALASTVTSSLEHLYLSGCAQISPHTVRYLKDVCIKGLHVEHRTPNAAPEQLMAKNLDTGQFCRADLMY